MMQYFKPQGNDLFAGDCMPFFHAGTFHVFYLLDAGHHKALDGLGGHQWAHAASPDLIHWTHYPLAIALTEDREGSICTGSVLYADSLFYGFYATRMRDGTQHVSLAISRDCVHFEKVDPNPLFSPPERYDPYHFRDPYVFRDDATGHYHMLVTARRAGTPLPEQGSCLAHLTSADLRAWDLQRPFLVPGFPDVPECPDYFYWNGWYYLIFSHGGAARYRISREPFGPWQRPVGDLLDGGAARVMKTAAFTGDRRIGVAFVGTRKGGKDTGRLLFGGQIVLREIIQHADGSLGTRFPPELLPPQGDPLALMPTPLTPGAIAAGSRIQLQAPEGLEAAVLAGVPRDVHITATVRPAANSAQFGLVLKAGDDLQSGYALRFLPFERRVELLDAALTCVDELADDFTIDVLVKGDLVDVCIGQRRCLINRCSERSGERLFFFAQNAAVVFDALEVRAIEPENGGGAFSRDGPTMHEPYRPQFHFSPPRNWMNDPNGMVYYEGEYHLFYQHNPDAMVHGTGRPMHWGHATSPDLVQWSHLPIALVPDHLGDIWSGSALVDWEDSTGFFGGGSGLVAVFTQGLDSVQQQSIAYSADRGRTWTMFAGNPVLTNPGLPDMRDPKVFWHAPARHWAMVLACGDHVRLYTSPNLRSWAYTSSFGRGRGSHTGVWECPDLFPLPLDGGPNTELWVLVVSVDSRVQYFIGQFTGDAFVEDTSAGGAQWADYGRDIYAAVTWSDTALQGGRRVWIGWMSDPRYAELTPTSPWRGALTLPRLLDLHVTPRGIRLVQRPIDALRQLRAPGYHWDQQAIAPGTNVLSGITGRTLEIVGEFAPSNSTELGFRVRAHGQHYTTIGYDPGSATLFVDRTQSGCTPVSPDFPGRHQAALHPAHGTIKIHFFVDWSSIEVFGNDGEVVITDLFFPDADDIGLELYTDGGAMTLHSLDVYPIMSIWR